MFKIFNYPTEEKIWDEKGVTLETLKLTTSPTIEFKNITYAPVVHENKKLDKFILHITDLKIPRNKITAIVGPSGAGKTTLTRLLLGCFSKDECTGKILIDGRDITNYTLSSLRSQIAIVPQQPKALLPEKDLKENICLGNQDNDATVNRIIRLMDLQSHVKDEVISGFSGGELQRVTLARACFKLKQKGARILILDEPTSGLDNETQAMVMRLLHRLKKTSTILLITHRLETLRHVDHTAFIESEIAGGVKTSSFFRLSTNKELLQTCPNYYRLYRQQVPISLLEIPLHLSEQNDKKYDDPLSERSKVRQKYCMLPIPQEELSWYHAILLAMLLPNLNDKNKFGESFEQLFGNTNDVNTIWFLLSDYDGTESFIQKNTLTWLFLYETYFKPQLQGIDKQNLLEKSSVFLQRSITIFHNGTQSRHISFESKSKGPDLYLEEKIHEEKQYYQCYVSSKILFFKLSKPAAKRKIPAGISAPTTTPFPTSSSTGSRTIEIDLKATEEMSLLSNSYSERRCCTIL